MQMDRLIAQMNRIEAKLDQLLNNKSCTSESPISDLDDFEHWWQLCPRKVGKKFARKCYWRVVKHDLPHVPDPHEYLRDRMAAYANSEIVSDGYACHPSTWLNQGRWDDDDAAWCRTNEGKSEFEARENA